MIYQLIALIIILILYLFSASWNSRLLNYKLNVTADVLNNLDKYLAQVGHDRAERRRFKREYMKDPKLRKLLAKRILTK